jgi:hypothetical protein
VNTEAELIKTESENTEGITPGSKKVQCPPLNMQPVSFTHQITEHKTAASQLLRLIDGLKTKRI